MILAVDTETTGRDFFHGCKPFMVQACDGESNYYWVGEVNPYNRAEVVWKDKDINQMYTLFDKADTLLFHNSKFDVRALSTIGIDLTDSWDRIRDTMVASHVVCSGEKHALKRLAFRYFGYYNENQHILRDAVKLAREQNKDYDLAKAGHPTMPGEDGKGTSWYVMDYWLCIEECIKYGIDDVEMTWLLWDMFHGVMERDGLLDIFETRQKLLPITYDMQTVGMHIYKDTVEETIEELTEKQLLLQEKIRKSLKIRNVINLNSEKDQRYIFFDVLELPPVAYTEKTGLPSVNKDAIAEYVQDYPDIQEVQDFGEYRTAATQSSYLNSYLKWVDDKSRLHSNLLITGTRETRQSSRHTELTEHRQEASTHLRPSPRKGVADLRPCQH